MTAVTVLCAALVGLVIVHMLKLIASRLNSIYEELVKIRCASTSLHDKVVSEVLYQQGMRRLTKRP